MQRVLFVATIDQHIRHFHLPFLEWFKERDYEVHVASNGQEHFASVDEKFDIPFEKSPFKLKNIFALKELKNLIDTNNYSIIHCHTPMGGAVARLASREARTKGTKVIYTAHGFHYYRGAPLINWLLYYPAERWLAKYTDTLVTINKEDYERAIDRNFRANRIEHVRGVGVDLEKYSPRTLNMKKKLRREYGYKEEDFILIYAGELSYRKHQDLLLKTISLLKEKVPGVKLLLVGTGDLLEQYKKQAEELGVNESVDFLGYRRDVAELMCMADVAVSSSRQEGLPVNILEAMATGLPLVVTDCRGNRDLVSRGENGFVVGVKDYSGFANSLNSLYKYPELRKTFSDRNIELAKAYGIGLALKDMQKIYLSSLEGRLTLKGNLANRYKRVNSN
ncbi:glycosyltransferase family 4 protein [Planococcus lenghuensis]|uniref:Glycosyltransferase family 1 protein n=1 Tax=Planococcus lenghuensis TaxID=2213202 RepID=A0A1Q2L2V5_9BACL|nr:glycosyltransferase family 4 protein [Planococcus lenghuensis]AQQ54222.1 glycosyltransferase family 1 protein [Planococcus lenghuensis]